MTAFVSSALEPPAVSVSLFDDDNDWRFQADIKRLAQAGIT